MEFVKYHGLGNDFVIVDARLGSALDVGSLNEDRIRRICDRSTGVGADGVLVVYTPDDTAVSPLGMRVFNADGSFSEMCGNGLRCVARYAWDRDLLPERATWVETGAGLLEVSPTPDGEVRVSMGSVLDHGAASVQVSGVSLPGRALSVGNPHFVMTHADWSPLIGDASTMAELVERARAWGPLIETHPLFPDRTNAGFLGLHDGGEVPLVVWERGSGLTGACGTGACAAATGLLISEGRSSGTVRVEQPGGWLTIEVSRGEGGWPVWMTGAAKAVFEGEYY